MDEVAGQLRDFGFSANEARCYATLLVEGRASGYEVARRSGVARGNVYTVLDRLLERRAITQADDDTYIATPVEEFALGRHADLEDALAGALEVLAKYRRSDDVAALPVFGHTAIHARATRLIEQASAPILIAAFPAELVALSSEFDAARQRGVTVEGIVFGEIPDGVDFCVSHHQADAITESQQGRLLMLTSWPDSLVAVISEDREPQGVWSSTRYLASAVGLYVAHERFLLDIWTKLPPGLQAEIEQSSTSLSSRIALGGLAPGNDLAVHLSGVIAPDSGTDR